MANMKKGEYKKPRAFNLVTVVLILLALGGGYWAWRFGPAYVAHYQVKQAVVEASHKYYKISFLGEEARAEASNQLVAETRKKIIDILGFEDPEMTVQLLVGDETNKKVKVVAEYTYPVFLPGPDFAIFNKTRYVRFQAEGDSDYENTGN